jgi:hypothetical protein
VTWRWTQPVADALSVAPATLRRWACLRLTKGACGLAASKVALDCRETRDLGREVASLELPPASRSHGIAAIHHRVPGATRPSPPPPADTAADSGEPLRSSDRPYAVWVPGHDPRAGQQGPPVSAGRDMAEFDAAIPQPASLFRSGAPLRAPRIGSAAEPFPGADCHKPLLAVDLPEKDAACSSGRHQPTGHL